MPFGPNAITTGYGHSQYVANGLSAQVLQYVPAQSPANTIITGGSIDNTPIGQSIPAAGSFTTLTATTPLGVVSGGTGISSSPSNGKLLIGNGTGYTLANLTAGSGISITNASGSITIAQTNSPGTVTSVAASGGSTGLTFSGSPITTSGTLTLGGTLAVGSGGTNATTASGARTNLGLVIGTDVLSPTGSAAGLTGLPLTTGVTGTLPLANGGTGQTTANAAFNALAPSQTGNSGKYLTTDGSNTSWAVNPLGTVTSVSVTTANGVSGTVANSTTTPAISLTLGDITPSSVTALSNSGGYQIIAGQLTSGDRVGISGQASGTGAALVFFDNAQTTFRPSIFDASQHTFKISGTATTSITSTGIQSAIGATSPSTGVFTNAYADTFSAGFTSVAAAGTVTTLVAASVRDWTVTGSGGQTYQLPDATTLRNGAMFQFNNNQSSGTVVVRNNSATTITTLQSGGYVEIILLSNSTAAGSWDVHNQAPSNVSWSTNTFDYAGSFTGGTWNGNAVAINRGGTGQTTAQLAINALAGAVTSGSYLRGNGSNVVMSTIQAADVPTLNQNTTGSAATLTTPRAIYGNNFDGSAALTQVIASTYGGTGNGFTKFSGPATSEKTFTLPNSNATLLYDGGALGTPSSGTVTNLTGTASININGTVGATTANTGAFTTLTSSFLAASGPLASFSVAQGLYGYYSSGGVIGAYSNNTGTLASLTLNGSSIDVRPAGSTVGLFSTTGLAVTGDLSSTGIISSTSSNQFPLRFSGATTNATAVQFTNTGGNSYFGAEGNATNNLIVGCTAYDTIIRGPSGIAFSANGGNNLHMRINSSGSVGIGNTPTAQLQVGTGTDAVGGTGTGQICLSGAGSTLAVTGKPAVYHRNSVGLGLYSDYAMSFEVNGGTTKSEAMRITNTGNVGIGTTSPDSILTFAGNITSKSSDNYGIGTNGGNNHFNVFATGASGAVRFWTGGSSATGTGGGGTERARIDSSGVLCVGATGFGYAVRAGFRGDSTSVSTVEIQNESSTGTMLTFRTNGESQVGSISFTASGVTYNTSSDYRRKSNVKDLTGSGSFIDALKPRTFDWDTGDKGVGFIAHEFAEVSPTSVCGEKDAVDADGKPIYQAMQASSAEVIANLVAELQSLRQRVAALESK